jgi:uncharacterized protein
MIATPVGDARVDVSRAVDRWATLVLGHGAGGGIGAADLVALAHRLPADGIEVIRVEQPWVVAGRKVATLPPTLDRAWLAVLEQLSVDGPLLVGGRSAGARVACRTASEVGAHGVLCLAFPLHPPGRPGPSRAAELAAAGTDVLVLNGDRDPFGIPEGSGRTRVVVLAGETHALSRHPGETGRAAGSWLRELLAPDG